MDRRTLLLIGLLLLPVTPVHALAKGDAVPDFQRPSLGGQSSVALADYAGQVVYLDFWASWCGPCRLSLPALDALYRELGDQGFVVLAVNVDAYQEDADAFLNSHPVSYPTLRDADSTLPKRFAVKGMPTAFLIDRDGRVQHVHEGFRKTDIEPLRRKIMALLEE
ncbi:MULTISPECIES: TlpA family protein disulfide reductase [Spongiibacter]|uniref:TlpA family protein disulfide reductase n=1 Tax=Spongiibacter TaxID=630749 RepID=UPI002354396D|nr:MULTISPECIES: TlpA disulfide reductase family protein [Spongiibacter]